MERKQITTTPAACSILEDRQNSIRYRIVAICRGCFILCQMDTNKFILTPCSYQEIASDIAHKTLVAVEEEQVVFNPDDLPEKIREDYWNKQKMMNEVLDAYGPDYLDLCGKNPKPELEAILEKYSIDRQVFRHICRRYFQSGLQAYALADYRTHGSNRGKEHSQGQKLGKKSEFFPDQGIPIDDEVRKYFDEALATYLQCDCMTMKDAYDEMNSLHYYDLETCHIFPESQRPTLRQFTYYVEKQITATDKALKMTNLQNYRNNCRLLRSDSSHNAFKPGQVVEIDALEPDVAVLSMLDLKQSVGRPYVYFMIDVATRVILAFSISFDTNSKRALGNLFLNLIDNKVDYCARYGLTLNDPELWPSGILPRQIRADKGSDFMSDWFADFCRANNIELQNVPPGTGSMKGVVERSFRQMHSQLNRYLDHYGRIVKSYDSQHNQEAVLTIEQYTAMMIDYVLWHNSHEMKHFRRNRAQIEAGVQASPKELWKYGVQTQTPPRQIIHRNDYLYSLMEPIKAKISRYGITYDGLNYWPQNDREMEADMLAAGNKTKPLDAKIDSRCIDAIYYTRDGKLYRAPLNNMLQGNADYSELTLYSWDRHRKSLGKQNAEARIRNENLDAGYNILEQIRMQSAASERTGYASGKNIREAKNRDKELVAAANKIENRFSDDAVGLLPGPTDNQSLPNPENASSGAEADESERKHYNSIDEALDDFDDDF